jgi:hypothetical protein
MTETLNPAMDATALASPSQDGMPLAPLPRHLFTFSRLCPFALPLHPSALPLCPSSLLPIPSLFHPFTPFTSFTPPLHPPSPPSPSSPPSPLCLILHCTIFFNPSTKRLSDSTFSRGCTTLGSPCTPVCGDGLIRGSEQCMFFFLSERKISEKRKKNETLFS